MNLRHVALTSIVTCTLSLAGLQSAQADSFQFMVSSGDSRYYNSRGPCYPSRNYNGYSSRHHDSRVVWVEPQPVAPHWVTRSQPLSHRELSRIRESYDEGYQQGYEQGYRDGRKKHHR